ncbi:MAG: PKD domain-containing protein [Oleispira sp.]|nr:PKD domain-containing protein [Oleispira sp.]
MLLRLIRFSIIAFMMIALSGCVGDDENPIDPNIPPTDSYSVELNAPDSVKQNTVFTMTATATENESAVSYQWTLNDGVISEDAIHHTMLPVLGEYTLTVVGTDEEGNEATESKVISVIAQDSLNSNFSFGINVSDKAGYALPEAPVTINGTTVTTDQFGHALFEGISQTSLMLVSASKAGYLTQTYQYSFDAMQENAVASLTLQNINPVSHIVDSTEAVDITETELHTKLLLAANSFVDAEGNAVTGEVEITITPIDIRAVDSAFLGGGQALTGSGEAVALISTGMADYQFSQNGSEVSLAEGATAIIEMDLAVTTGDDGRVFAEGDTIEMWWFDSATGFWIEDGMGTVQLSETSDTGLKLVATVSHFTTWNWDYYKQDNRSSITFKCLKDGQPLLTDESCQIKVSSTSINRQFVASSEGITAINTPPNVTYSVAGSLTTEDSVWAGSTILTSMPGDNSVSVNLERADTQTGFIQCRVINSAVNSIVPCDAKISAGAIVTQNINTADFNNSRASFPYVQGDLVDISASIGKSPKESVEINTNNINGILNVEIVFDITFGFLQCTAILDGSDMQSFPCDALVHYDGIEYLIRTDEFSGNPLKAYFTYTSGTQELSIDVASIFNGAHLRDREDGLFFEGEPTAASINLSGAVVVANASYDVNTENLYSVECFDMEGNNRNCDVNFNNSRNYFLIDELSGPHISPTWMNGKVYFKTTPNGVGRASSRIGNRMFIDEAYDVDTENRVITFILDVEEPT